MRNLLPMLAIGTLVLTLALVTQATGPTASTHETRPAPQSTELTRETGAGSASATAASPQSSSTLKPGHQLSPMMQEIHDVIQTEKETLADLQARVASAPDEEALLGLIRQVESVKKNSEIQILQIQANYARQANLEEKAREIEELIEVLQSPAPRREPQARPAPDHQ